MMNHNLNKKELFRERIQMADGMMADLVTYDIENYGVAEFVENIEQSNGEFRRSHSLLPQNYLNSRMHEFRWNMYNEDVTEQKLIVNTFLTNFIGFQDEGKGLYIYSQTKGSGKTLLSCCLANEVMEYHDIPVKFISVVDFIERTKDSFNDYTVKQELDRIIEASLLIIDDIGAETRKDWIDSILFRIIDSRYTNKRVTIFTSNVEREKLKLNDRIKDRIFDMTILLSLPEKPIRQQMAEVNNKEFLQRMIDTTRQPGKLRAPKG